MIGLVTTHGMDEGPCALSQMDERVTMPPLRYLTELRNMNPRLSIPCLFLTALTLAGCSSGGVSPNGGSGQTPPTASEQQLTNAKRACNEEAVSLLGTRPSSNSDQTRQRLTTAWARAYSSQFSYCMHVAGWETQAGDDEFLNEKGDVVARFTRIAQSNTESTAVSAPKPRSVIAVLPDSSTRDGVREIQQRLADRGYSPGPIDGLFGPQTREAMRAFQQSESLAADGQFNDVSLQRLFR
ncbi:peptidoglycan-binding domain-containing protein [Gammaproteobacteria bacterium]|nr:peptidoglycan-binding domain-containing protein [Gammaproteobacteria bacterium]